MLRQTLKGVTMLTLIVGLALVTAAVTAKAQSTNVVSDIPFKFIVGDKTLPSGNYLVSSATSGGDVLRISSRKENASTMRLTNSVQGKAGNTKPRLIFHRYGEQYFLAEVWTGESTGRQLRKSSQERALQRELTKIAAKSESGTRSYELVEVVAIAR
jgi:hypothetical protein